MTISNKKCLICNGGKGNDTLYWHLDPETKKIWCYCNKCARGYSIEQYVYKAGISLKDFLKGDFDFQTTKPNEVSAMAWPNHFVPMSDPRAKPGIEYLASRGLTPEGDLYFDLKDNGIVLPMYFGEMFCGAQVRFIEPRITKDGDIWKITTLSGTRLGLLIYGANQTFIMPQVKAIVVFEGAFNSLSVQQALNKMYGGLVNNPFRAVACSGSGGSKHQVEYFKELKDRGYKIICCPDHDEAGLKMLAKYTEAQAITHYALTDTEADWNDELVKLGRREFAKYFLQRIKKV